MFVAFLVDWDKEFHILTALQLNEYFSQLLVGRGTYNLSIFHPLLSCVLVLSEHRSQEDIVRKLSVVHSPSLCKSLPFQLISES